MNSVNAEKSPGYQVRLTHRVFDRLLTARLAKHGLKAGYWYFLRVLWVTEGLTQKELGDAISVKENTTVAMIMKMEADGLVVRKRHETDGRKMCIYLTEKARKLEKKLMPIAAEINGTATAGVSKKDLDICLKVLRKLHANLLDVDY